MKLNKISIFLQMSAFAETCLYPVISTSGQAKFIAISQPTRLISERETSLNCWPSPEFRRIVVINYISVFCKNC